MSPGPFRKLQPDDLRPDQVEEEIAHLPFERAYLFDALGRQICRFDGDESIIVMTLNPTERSRLRDGLMIHNHPPNLDVPRDDPRFDSASFSDLDVRWAAEHDLSSIVAVSPSWRHTMLRPGAGWYGVLPTRAEFEDGIDLLYDVVQGELERRIDAGAVSRAEAQALLAHQVNERFSREIGAVYQKERR